MVALAARDGAQRRAAHAEKLCERRDNADNRERQSDSRQRQRRRLREMADVHAIDNAVQHVNELRRRHRQGEVHNTACNASLGKVVFRFRQFSSTPSKGPRPKHVFARVPLVAGARPAGVGTRAAILSARIAA